ncbi:hypothetical protein [Flavobacterium sp. H122]|uniref:hypothetical protein n=1 Tax=Flavobacterium sp. H122 TaxID=2529860 RepID=UPI0010AB3F9F|nr:hypothetical protein [Flavobacterium sp. H122]
MKSKILSIKGAEMLSNEKLKQIKGGAKVDLSLCGCSCSGSVTGPDYCVIYFACTQGYTCQEEI